MRSMIGYDIRSAPSLDMMSEEAFRRYKDRQSKSPRESEFASMKQ